MIKTGKTFRTILKALLKTSEGERVIHVSKTEYGAYTCFVKASDMLMAAGIMAQLRRCCVIIGDGRLDFMSQGEFEKKSDGETYKGISKVCKIKDL